jgi:hypothetical protein
MRKALTVLALFGTLGLIGCANSETPSEKKADEKKVGKSGGPTAAKGDTKHEGWWCDEHGLPEEECWACSDKYAQKCKKEGDWCTKHERPQSQCFKCEPKLKAEWAKKYFARYGKQPPEPEDY